MQVRRIASYPAIALVGLVAAYLSHLLGLDAPARFLFATLVLIVSVAFALGTRLAPRTRSGRRDGGPTAHGLQAPSEPAQQTRPDAQQGPAPRELRPPDPPAPVAVPRLDDAYRTRSCATSLVCHHCDAQYPLHGETRQCEQCGKGLDVAYDYELAARLLREIPSSERPYNLWHFEELLPITESRAQAWVGWQSGYTPLIRAHRLGAELGLTNLYLKDDSSCRPSWSYKDRVVSTAVARLLEMGKSQIGCASTGNTGASLAALAAKAGVHAYVFYPQRLESMKARECAALGATVCQVDANYDELVRGCRAVAELADLEFANITLRPFYAEGAKTLAFETVQQLGWTAPDHIVVPVAGGTLASRTHKGLGELQLLGLAETDSTRIHIAQPEGSNPIATAVLAEEAEVHPVRPETAAHQLAIGAPGEGYLVVDAVRARGGTAGVATDSEIFAGINLLAATEGILTEPAGGTTIAVLEKLAAAGCFGPNDTVVAAITGNGLKTLDDHPSLPWPAKVPCEPGVMAQIIIDWDFGKARMPVPG
ncbi:MAG TPA: threonine synthase [Solirubrobacteraceae bacterium]